MRRAWKLAAVLVLAGCAALAVDLPVAELCWKEPGSETSGFRLPGDVRKAIHLTEVFGQGFGAGLILLTVYVLDRAGRWKLPRMIACVYGAGLAANGLKLLVVRLRPHAFLAAHRDLSASTVMDTFDFHRLLPLIGAGSGGRSFPSAHSATAAGLAVALAWRYPQGRWLFGTFALFVACQRIVASAHYVSDTLWGLAVGVMVASAIVHTRRLGSVFDRLEQRTWDRGLSP